MGRARLDWRRLFAIDLSKGSEENSDSYFEQPKVKCRKITAIKAPQGREVVSGALSWKHMLNDKIGKI